MPDQAFSLSSSGPYPQSDLLGYYRTCLVQTMTDSIVVFVFLPESCVSVLFVLAFAAAWLQGELNLSYGIVVMDRTIALILPRPLQVK